MWGELAPGYLVETDEADGVVLGRMYRGVLIAERYVPFRLVSLIARRYNWPVS